ncbi:ACP S-malonyltransferase [Streptomyces sp. NPDC050263]|uniref:ACP S-malonyltransferase n=1 Tax=Streptomyces sp. NPDC050263 TaxID=3155037 RepID=UPI0034247AE2
MTTPTGRRTVFMFSGQGSQTYQMGRELYDGEPVFRDALHRLDALVAPELGGSVVARLYDPSHPVSEPFTDTVVTHPAIVMVELALAETLISYGVVPDLLLGVSLGEYTAAVLAGVLEPGECLRRLVGTARSAADAAPGGMLAVLAEPGLYDREPDLHRDLDLAGRNYDAHFVVSGPPAALERAERLLTAREIAHQRVPVSHAFHSRLMDPSRPAFDALWADVEFRPPRLPMISSATAAPLTEVTVGHLWRVARDPIEFAATIGELEPQGPFLYVDAGPSGTLHNFLRAHLAARPDSGSESLALLTPFTRDTHRLARVRERASDGGVRRTAPGPVPTTAAAAPHAKGPRRMKVYGFPGQGSQAKGMGADLFDEFPEQVAQADEILGYSIRDLCLNNPEGRLRRTEFTQPALYVVEALAHQRRTREDPRPADRLVGHSLGEYAALLAADVFDFATGLRLVARRGELMSRSADGRMAAVLGLSLDLVEATLSEAGPTAVDIANHNAPEQIVLAGPTADIDRVRALFEERGAQVVVLNVSAPFHSRHMRDAADEFRELLDVTEFRPPRIPVIANLDALPYRADRVRETLAGQMTGRVRWVDTVRRLMAEGDFEFEELGPGRALTKMVRKIRETSTPLALPPAEPGPRPPAVPRPTAVPAPARAEPPAPAPALPAAPVPVARRGPSGEELGAQGFRARYGLRLAYLAGGMYGGVSSEALVVRLAKAGGMGFLGAGGLPLAEVEDGIRAVQASLGPGGPFGVNLLHRHACPEEERALVDLLLRLGVGTVEASGFLRITPALVRYRLRGGRIIAKVSRADTAEAFLRPAPDDMVRGLVERGEATERQAARAAGLPMADDLCVEADGGWLTGAAGLSTLLPAVLRLRDALAVTGAPKVHVGAAGGIGTPEAAAAALVLGAEFLVTGSVNQCTVEAATSPEVKDLLQRLDVQDTEPTPWSEMFELGVRARAVKRGVFLPARADRLYQLWRMHDSFDAIDARTRRQIEETYLRRPFEDACAATETDPKRRLALAFRSYLDDGFALAREGAPGRRVDYLIHCGPAMGAFNQWVKGTGLEPWQARNVDVVADRLLTATARLIAAFKG